MAILYSFSDDTSYGTEDVNKITQRLVGAGVSPFPSKDAYNTSELNLLTEAVVGTGTQRDGCICSLRDVDGSNEISVAQGTVFFGNGVTLDVDEDGYQFLIPYDTAGYVYAYLNVGLQTAEILFSEEVFEDECAVLLAQINADNTISDKRVIARSKVATFGTNVTYKTDFVFHDPVLYYLDDNKNQAVGYYTVASIDADISKFNYAILESVDNPGLSTKAGGIFDLKTAQFVFSVYGTDPASWRKKYLFLASAGLYYGMDIVDGKLYLIVYCHPERIKYYTKHMDEYTVVLI